jgi:hypothetical protein
MGASESLIAKLDELIALFNARRMDLPGGLFDRKTQFVLNGSPYETLVGRSPDDPLVLMLTRGPAGYRFAAKAIQHAVPDAKIERGDLTSAADGTLATRLWLSGHLRDTQDSVETIVDVTLQMAVAGWVEQASVAIDSASLERLHRARLAL